MKDSVLPRLVIASIVGLVLLVPIVMVRGVVEERKGRAAEAAAEVTGTWGGEQSVLGPALVVPYRKSWTDAKGRPQSCTAAAAFLPDRLEVTGEVRPEVRRRGIFEVVLYRTELTLSGSFPSPSLEPSDDARRDLLPAEAVFSLGLADTRGIRESLSLTWNGAGIPMAPGSGGGLLGASGVHARLPFLEEKAGVPNRFRLRVPLQGSRELLFAPVGADTLVSLRSPWPAPGFTGAFLPDRRTVSPAGFSAEWRVSRFGRSYPQRGTTEDPGWKERVDAIPRSAFGVRLVRPADPYQQVTRALKYAVLFLVLTFAVVFGFELRGGPRLQPLAYLLVGAALALFYLLLLALSEHVGFPAAYGVAAAAIAGLVSAYARSVLSSGRRAALLGALLVALYGYLFVLLRLQDHALLAGALGLVVVLACVMWLTRRLAHESPNPPAFSKPPLPPPFASPFPSPPPPPPAGC